MARPYFLVRVLNDQGAAYERDPLHTGGSESYTDFWRLARLTKTPMVELHHVDLLSTNTYIFAPANGYTAGAFTGRPRTCRLIHWNIERPGIEIEPYVDEMWVSDKTQYQMAGGAAEPKVKYVPLGGHIGMAVAPQLPKMWDYCPMAYAYGERALKLHNLAEKGITIAPSSFTPSEKEILLAHSRYGLMLHQTQHPIMTPLRAVLFALARLPIVAEHVGDSYPYRFIPFDAEKGLPSLSEKEIEDIVEHNFFVAANLFPFKDTIEANL